MTVTVAVTFLFFIFFEFKISRGEDTAWIREWPEWGTFYFKRRKKGEKEGQEMAWKQEKSLLFSYFLFLYFFCFLIWGGRNFSKAAGLGRNYYDKRTSENEFPKALKLIIFVFLVMAPAKTKICMEQKFILLKHSIHKKLSLLPNLFTQNPLI